MKFDKKYSSLSLKNKLKLLCASCCSFSDSEEDDDKMKLEHSEKNQSLLSWLKSELPDVKDLCANIFSGKHGRNRRSNSVEFRYDPLSYALNFEDDDSHLDEYPIRNFSSRLPPSPVKESKNGVVSDRS
ncbi:uncharacterized protein LOC130804051 [Amaranthus tricolor]|uniref:uncharacterized protein LOC130804051 n=1 Tax=Amaranthus tricolor TaxID=29722 RepID=UPI0025907AD8|nr:uncharacterized protein LOC130804051 [Amaranthus tricolor]